METALKLTQTHIGKKAVMAVSGCLLFGFVLVHFAGNLSVYAGPQAMYNYAKGLRTIPGGLWVARAGLLALIVAHVASAVALYKANKTARPGRYAVQRDLATNYAAKTMYFSGPILTFYILFHIAHLTLGKVPVHEFSDYNVYNNFVYGFQVWWISLLYIIGNGALGIHLYHGMWSMFQSLGLNHPRYNALRRQFATAFALLITVGNISYPIAVMAGFLKPTTMTFGPF